MDHKKIITQLDILIEHLEKGNILDEKMLLKLKNAQALIEFQNTRIENQRKTLMWMGNKHIKLKEWVANTRVSKLQEAKSMLDERLCEQYNLNTELQGKIKDYEEIIADLTVRVSSQKIRVKPHKHRKEGDKIGLEKRSD